MGKTIKPPTERQYQKAKVLLALNWVSIKSCRKCGWPVIDGYCCPTCKTDTPDTTVEEDKCL